jgi:hypothetical protein
MHLSIFNYLRNCVCFYALWSLARHFKQNVNEAVSRAGEELRHDSIENDGTRYVLQQVICGAGMGCVHGTCINFVDVHITSDPRGVGGKGEGHQKWKVMRDGRS